MAEVLILIAEISILQRTFFQESKFFKELPQFTDNFFLFPFRFEEVIQIELKVFLFS